LGQNLKVPSTKISSADLGQVWYRKMQNLGLSQDYKDSDSEIGKWLKSFGLHFLDPTEVEDCFVQKLQTWISFGCKLKFLSVQAVFKEFHIFLCQIS
jgi:hypothetical protein